MVMFSDSLDDRLKRITSKDLLYTLLQILNEDYYVHDFSNTKLQLDFLCALEENDLVFITQTEYRVLLTRTGKYIAENLHSKLI
jgi:hypothetical protein